MQLQLQQQQQLPARWGPAGIFKMAAAWTGGVQLATKCTNRIMAVQGFDLLKLPISNWQLQSPVGAASKHTHHDGRIDRSFGGSTVRQLDFCSPGGALVHVLQTFCRALLKVISLALGLLGSAGSSTWRNCFRWMLHVVV